MLPRVGRLGSRVIPPQAGAHHNALTFRRACRCAGAGKNVAVEHLIDLDALAKRLGLPRLWLAP